MNSYEFFGPFSSYIKDHIELKQSIGYKYETQAQHLVRFSKFTAKTHPNAKSLTKEIVLDWCQKKKYESVENQRCRGSIMRQLALYMNEVGASAYVLPKGCYPKHTKYISYIYTEDELKRFFYETDKCKYISECPNRHLIMPVLFRMIYSCGLRLSEARLLTVEDVNLDDGVLSIHHSKKDNSRLVPMSDQLTERCREYFSKVHLLSTRNSFFFPDSKGNPLTVVNIYKNFRRFLWKANISHGGRGKGPRIYDFRHTHACNCLKKWVLEEKDLMVYLPFLRTYMGHDSFEETAYYLKLTADVFLNISIKLEGCYPNIVPSLEGGTFNAD